MIFTTINTSSILAPFLPGVSSSLSRLLTGDVKQGQAVFASALRALGAFLCAVFSNRSLVVSKDCKPLSSETHESASYVMCITLSHNNILFNTPGCALSRQTSGCKRADLDWSQWSAKQPRHCCYTSLCVLESHSPSSQQASSSRALCAVNMYCCYCV